MKKIFLIILLTFIIPFACSSAEKRRNAIINDGIHHIKNYSFNPYSDIISRIKPIPAKHLKKLMELDNRKDYSAYRPTRQELQLFREYFKQLPALNKKAMMETTVAVYFVKNFLGGGMSDFIAGHNNEVFTVLYINPEVFSKTFSQWITYREASSFKKGDGAIRLDINCGNKYSALMYILVHESAHLVDYVYNINPYVEPSYADVFGIKVNAKSFTEGVWKDYKVPVSQYNIDDADRLTFYGLSQATVPDTKIAGMYENLKKTPFVSLYGCRNWAEDFAESLTFYHLTQVLKQPYIITVNDNNKTIMNYSPVNSSLVKNRWDIFEIVYQTRKKIRKK
jgi:hypothetical protein